MNGFLFFFSVVMVVCAHQPATQPAIPECLVVVILSLLILTEGSVWFGFVFVVVCFGMLRAYKLENNVCVTALRACDFIFVLFTTRSSLFIISFSLYLTLSLLFEIECHSWRKNH